MEKLTLSEPHTPIRTRALRPAWLTTQRHRSSGGLGRIDAGCSDASLHDPQHVSHAGIYME